MVRQWRWRQEKRTDCPFQIAEFGQFPEQPYRGRLGKFQFPDQFRRQHRMVLLGHIFEYPERFLKNLDHFSA